MGNIALKELDALPRAKQDFLRFEFKYILHHELRAMIEEDLRHFMAFDPFVELQPNHQYLVHSLYFDDPAYSSYYEKTEGMLRRAKFRLRTYTANPLDRCQAFLELKGRHNNLVFKHRATLSCNSSLLAGALDISSQIVRHAQDNAVSQRFQYELARSHLRPVMLIDYMRRPYVSRYDHEFRVTFDDHVRATHTREFFPRASTPSRAVLPGYSIMEVKFKNQFPAWFHRVVKNYDLRRVSISKICAGIEQWQLVPALD